MTTRALILEKAAELLAQSTSGDVSTRAVCEAAGVTQPVLYRLFGDKDGLLAATTDLVWDQYLSMKRSAEKSDDPLRDLEAGWDGHVAFALAHPHAYRLLFGTAWATAPASGGEAMRLLQADLGRLAAQGRLRIPPSEAARIVMAASTGLALALLLRPDAYPDLSISGVMRDAVFGSVLVDAPGRTAAGQAPVVAATTLRSSLADASPDALFTPAEAGLLDDWLARVQSRYRD